jgi:hypothetical protein
MSNLSTTTKGEFPVSFEQTRSVAPDFVCSFGPIDMDEGALLWDSLGSDGR